MVVYSDVRSRSVIIVATYKDFSQASINVLSIA